MASQVDILGLGITAVDDVLYVHSFPASDQKARVTRSVRRCGGLTGTALIAAARLGARCAYGGGLGLDPLSEYIAANFAREGVGLEWTRRLPEGRVVHSVIVVGEDTGSRNIFYEVEGCLGALDGEPPPEVIRAARVLFLDQYGMPGNLRAARIAREAGVAVVADMEDSSSALFPQVLALVDHLVLSRDFALGLTGTTTPAAAARALWLPGRAAVIVTCGAEGCWSLAAEAGLVPVHHPAFRIQAVDTTGCGDVFHGAYAAGLARGEGLAARIRLASAAAALNARDAGVPALAAVQRFLLDNPPAP